MGTQANDYVTLVDAMNDLKERGYKSDFRVINCEDSEESAEGCKMHSDTSGKDYDARQLKIREHYRFEGPSNPDDMSVLYAVACEGNEKGLLVDAYGTYSSRQMIDFIQAIPIETDPSQAV